MRLYRWSGAAVVLAAVAIAMLVFVDWPWAWPFIVTSWACSYMQARGPLANRKRMRLADRAADIIRQAHEQVPISANSLKTLERSGNRRRPFEPFCECPRCGLLTHHVFGAPREQLDDPGPRRWMLGVGDVWMANYETVSAWNSERTYRVQRSDSDIVEVHPQFSTVVDRECLSCGHEWTESVS